MGQEDKSYLHLPVSWGSWCPGGRVKFRRCYLETPCPWTTQGERSQRSLLPLWRLKACRCPGQLSVSPGCRAQTILAGHWENFPSLVSQPLRDGVGQAVQGKRAPDTGTSSPGNSLKDPISQEVLEQHAHQIGRHESEIDTHQCCQRYRTVRTHTCCWWKPTLGGSFGEQSGSAQ